MNHMNGVSMNGKQWPPENRAIPTMKVSVEGVQDDAGNLKIITEIGNAVNAEVINLKSRLVKRALISQGWIPPSQSMAWPEFFRVVWQRLNR
jgi:hypothetical protein